MLDILVVVGVVGLVVVVVEVVVVVGVVVVVVVVVVDADKKYEFINKLSVKCNNIQNAKMCCNSVWITCLSISAHVLIGLQYYLTSRTFAICNIHSVLWRHLIKGASWYNCHSVKIWKKDVFFFTDVILFVHTLV